MFRVQSYLIYDVVAQTGWRSRRRCTRGYSETNPRCATSDLIRASNRDVTRQIERGANTAIFLEKYLTLSRYHRRAHLHRGGVFRNDNPTRRSATALTLQIGAVR